MISSSISSSIGGLMTFVEIILTVIIGSTLLKNFNYSLKDKINAVRNGQISQDDFVKSSIGKAIGAILLIIPGFFTDILGGLLQFSLFTMILSSILKLKTSSNNSNYQNQYSSTYTQFDTKTKTKTKYKGDDDVIDVEVIDNNQCIDS
jgi:2-isopropylmalate synthase/UPF0716 protein FxsA